MPYTVNVTIDDKIVERVKFEDQDVKMVRPWGAAIAQGDIRFIEEMGRLCYASESKGEPEKFVKNLIARGHESVIEHVVMSFVIKCSRVTSHQLVRHRIASYSQASFRYINFNKADDTPIVFCNPVPMMHRAGYEIYQGTCVQAFANYVSLIEMAIEADRARMAIPDGVMTTVGATMNLREWRHVFQLRMAKGASPAIRQLMKRMWVMAATTYPCVFEDIQVPQDLIETEYK